MVFNIMSGVNKTNDINKKDTSKVWKQLLLSFLASIPFFTNGVETTVLSTSAHAGHFINTTAEVPWSSTSLILAAIISAPIYCYLADRCGRRSGVYIISLSQGASCIPLFLPPTDVSVIILHILAGVAAGGLFTVLPMYIREISANSIRGVNLSMMMALTTAGYLMSLVIDLEAMMFLLVGLIAAQFLTLLVLMETPSYLVMAGKDEAAVASIAKLKCVSVDDPAVNKEVKSLKRESERARSNGKLTLWTILKNQIYRDITKIGLVLYTTMMLNGSIVFLDEQKTLVQVKMGLDSDNTLILACIACGSLTTVALVRFLDRKIILIVAYIVMSIAAAVLAIYTQADLIISTQRMVPMVSLGFLVFAYGVAWGIPIFIMTEMLNLEIRSTIMCFLFVYGQLVKLAHIHTYHYIEEYVGIYTILYVYAVVNMFGKVYTLFIMPVIKDKNVRQIERQFKRVPVLEFKMVRL